MAETVLREEIMMARVIAAAVARYFSVPEHRAEFERDWKEKTGKDYVWDHYDPKEDNHER